MPQEALKGAMPTISQVVRFLRYTLDMEIHSVPDTAVSPIY